VPTDKGPPEKERPGGLPSRQGQTRKLVDTTTNRLHDIATPRQCRRNAPAGLRASGFKEGFKRGALDALRLASREIDDPDVWLVLARLAERYSEDYGLAS
jgi:hypothetical protein